MASKFWYLTGLSLKKKMKTKWFLLANVILLVAIVGLINIDSIIGFFGGDFNDTNEVVILDYTDQVVSVFEQNLKRSNELFGTDYQTKIEVFEKSEEDLETELRESSKIGLVFRQDPESYLTVTIISDKKIDSLYYQTLVQALNTTKTQIAMRLTNIDLEELNKINSSVAIERIILDEKAKNEQESTAMIMGTVFPTVILPFFMLVIFLVQMIGSEINEEKTTRSMEIIISNVSPKVHFFSKVFASNVFVILQGLLLMFYGGIGLFLRTNFSTVPNSSFTDRVHETWSMLTTTSFMEKLYYVIPLTLLLMLLSFIAYSLVAGILASMTVNMEDFQQIQTPIMLVSMISYYLAIMAGMFEGSIFIRILSYLPFISCLLAPALLVVGQIGIIDVIISVILLIGFIFVAIKYGLKIYKIGILNYSTDKMWSKLFQAARTKKI